MKEYIIQIITASLGSLGFALLFNLRKRHLAIASLNGLLCWSIYLLCNNLFGLDIFFSTLIASVWTASYAEIFARIRKTPASQFMIIGLIPLVPGASLYRSMQALVENNLPKASLYSTATIKYTLGIAAGICLVYTITNIIHNLKRLQSK